MATVKKLNTTYTIDTTDVFITGNLIVLGANTTVSTTNTNIKDNIITLNSGEVGAGVTLGNAGISVDRGVSTDVNLIWNDTTETWQISDVTGNYANILASTSSGTALLNVSDDTSPELGGDLDLLNFKIFSSTNNVKIDSNIQIAHATTIPSTTPASTTLLYSEDPAAGQTGLYVINASVANQELITKQRAFGFSLIL